MEAWIWEYKNEFIAEGEPGHQGEMVVYFRPEDNLWLFTFDSYGTSGEMIEWVLAKPDGTYLFKLNDIHGENSFETQRVEFKHIENLPDYLQPNHETKVFNINDFGFEPISGNGFTMNYEKTTEKSHLYIGKMKYNFQPLYHFNQLNSDAKIPINFMMDLPQNYMLLEEVAQSTNHTVSYRFKEISNTEYYIYLPK